MQPPLNAEKILATLAKIRAGMPLDRFPPAKKQEPTESDLGAQSMEDFELLTVAEALESLADDARAVVDGANQALLENALDIYYAAEELSRDPEHSELIPHVENMRSAYESHYGHAIPTKEETERRRRRGQEAP
jgi:hypothetical protein